jgi:cytochrome c oxidase assembly protein subunit 15
LALAVAAMLLVQAALGIATLLLTVPLPLALAHQFVAAGLISLATALAWRARRI